MSENHGTVTAAFSATDLRHRMAERESAKAAEELRQMKEQQEKQKAVMAEFHRPPDRTPEQLLQARAIRACYLADPLCSILKENLHKFGQSPAILHYFGDHLEADGIYCDGRSASRTHLVEQSLYLFPAATPP